MPSIKTGQEGTRDYGWFFGLQFFMRLAIVIIFEIESLVIVYLVMVEVMQPYKHHREYVHLFQDKGWVSSPP